MSTIITSHSPCQGCGHPQPWYGGRCESGGWKDQIPTCILISGPTYGIHQKTV